MKEKAIMRTKYLGTFLLAATALAAAQTSSVQLPSVEQVIQRNTDPYAGSVQQGKATAEVLQISIQDAIQRGLKYNLGTYLSGRNTDLARAERRRALSDILPNVNGSLSQEEEKINLAALGFNASAFGGALPIPSSVGPFGVSDVRARATWSAIDLHSIDNVRAQSKNVGAAKLSFSDARETVVLAVGANYLLTVAAESQLTAANAELKTAQALLQLATDQENAGLAANIDTLRAQVEVQSRSEAEIQAENALEKQRVALARAIGLPVGQKFVLVNRVPYHQIPEIELNHAVEQALQTRPDYLAAVEQLKAAELSRSSAKSEYLPSLVFSGDYGVIGLHPSTLSPSWTATGTLHIPIFQGGKVQADVAAADAQLAQTRAKVADLKGRVEQDVVNASLDLRTAARQVEAARLGLEYANRALEQAQDRFAAGLTNNIEVVQAQDALASANDQYISAVYAHNIAKVLLARAIGNAEQAVTTYLNEPGNTNQPVTPTALTAPKQP
jgi:outer membrane protein TolC